jgi:hypothetical protein
MKTQLPRSILAGTIAITGMIGSPVLAQDQVAPPLVKQLNNGNWLPRTEAEALRDELFYQRSWRAQQAAMSPSRTAVAKAVSRRQA